MLTSRRYGRHVGDVLAGQEDLARVRHQESAEHAQRRGLAAAGRPEDREELAREDVEIEVVHGDLAGRIDLRDRAQRHGDDGITRHLRPPGGGSGRRCGRRATRSIASAKPTQVSAITIMITPIALTTGVTPKRSML